MKFRRDHRAHNTSEGIKVIQPRPCPRSNIGVRDRNTTKGHEDGKEGRVEQDGDLYGRREGTDELRESDTEKLDEDEDEELESGPIETRSAFAKSNGVDHQNPVQYGTENRVRDLRDQLANSERLGGIDATVIFADEGHPLQHPQRCQLSLDNGGENTCPENGKGSRLKVTSTVPKLQEAQGDDERDDDVDEQASVDVVR